MLWTLICSYGQTNGGLDRPTMNSNALQISEENIQLRQTVRQYFGPVTTSTEIRLRRCSEDDARDARHSNRLTASIKRTIVVDLSMFVHATVDDLRFGVGLEFKSRRIPRFDKTYNIYHA